MKKIFLNQINPQNLENNIVLPYSLITFKKPNIIKPQILSQNVGVCANQFRGDPPNDLFNWIYYQQSFGIAELMIYDGTINKTTIKFLNDNFRTYDKIKLTLVDDQSLYYDQCTEPIFYKQFENRNSSKLNDLLFNLCHKLHI